jgi:hypothetical protein
MIGWAHTYLLTFSHINLDTHYVRTEIHRNIYLVHICLYTKTYVYIVYAGVSALVQIHT